MLGVIGIAVTLVSALPQPAISQPVIMTVETGTGNDTLYLETRGSIRFMFDAQGALPAAVTYPLIFYFSNGNIIGQVEVGEEFFLTCLTVFPPDPRVDYGEPTDPDTLLFAYLDFNAGGIACPGGEVARIEFQPLDTGLITIDSGLVAGVYMEVLGQSANPLPFTWNTKTIAVVPCPVRVGDVQANGSMDAADIIYLVAYVFRSGPEPLPRVEAGDVDCSGTIGSADVIYLVNHVFKSGAAPCGCSLGAGL
jgi:hypothetical protein